MVLLQRQKIRLEKAECRYRSALLSFPNLLSAEENSHFITFLVKSTTQRENYSLVMISKHDDVPEKSPMHKILNRNANENMSQ